ncbi:hypothetical protein K1T71_001486 [Dendrolimus kikuchii]|uniref:Uncharacterized protein n=1 Tax=Dendrolimus kikuchii TaxID=765133 RepID=A0ACC1DHX6_9NEOP|nr:hypothetical protein K1T71_001486 [Dendrolimus kikuchii]
MVLVQVNEGILEGETVINDYGGTYCSFKGIPYAAPPVGELRFKAPQPPKPWKGIKIAKQFGPVCYQCYTPTAAPFGSEDCLYLNVYTPETKPSKPLPVMFWIHGGGFVAGSGNDDLYGPEFLVRLGVILVTFNYRLGALGFLSLDTEDIPGNAGMKDQVAALRWVSKNISNFGGDPNNITIFGQSAGGICVSYFLISPMTKGFFRRAIVMSGAAPCFWGEAFEPRERALTLAKQLGCYSQDDKELSEFFQSQPLENLVNLQLHVVHNHKPYDILFSIVDEKQFGNKERFFYGDPIEALKHNTHEEVDVIHGYTKDEGYLILKIPNCDVEILRDLANNYLEFLAPTPITTSCPIKIQLQEEK